jgi:hypothetical protein
MATERQIQEAIAQCVSAMVYYHNCDRSQETEDQMVAEIQVVAAFVKELDLPFRTSRTEYLRISDPWSVQAS